ncbi:MAG: AI-2E family transporter [Planctomycetota bacterium]|nr:AI-2E family transporter [Planctomycetota bacterium]MDG2143705.1 AI-2E family transporter [Planctomycetota bacterium]
MIQNLSHSKRNLALAALGFLFLWFVWSIRSVVNPLLLGYLTAFILHPMVSKLEGKGMSRGRAVTTVFAAWFLGGVVVFGGLISQGSALVIEIVNDEALAGEIRAEVQVAREKVLDVTGFELPQIALGDIYEMVRARITEAVGMGEDGQVPSAEGVEVVPTNDPGAGIKGVATNVSLRAASGLGDALRRFLGSLLGIGGMIFLVPLYAYYLLFELGSMHSSMKRYLPKRDREKLANVGRQIGAMLAAFFRGRLLVCLLKGAILTVGLLIADIEYAFLFGMTGGLLSLIPIVGPLIGFLIAAVLTVASPEHSMLSALLRTGVVFGVGELIEGYILMPKIIGDSLRMNEVEVLFYLMAGGAALGMLGVLIALPLAAAIKIVMSNIVLPALRDFSDELDEATEKG